MKGKNELRLNEQTLVEALQEWIDKRMGAHAPKVESVSLERESSRYESGLFKVVVTERAIESGGAPCPTPQ